MSTVTRTIKTCPNCGCAMRYVPLLGRLKCDYCDGETNVCKHLETLAEMDHYIVPHRMESAHAIHALAVKFATDDSYSDNALSKVQVFHTEIVLLPCYRYHYLDTVSRQTITKTYYAGRIDGIDYAMAQAMVEKSIPYVQKFAGEYITDEVVSFDSPYGAQRYFLAPQLKHNQRHHKIKKTDYIHVAVARVLYCYEGKSQVFWCTCYRHDKLYSPTEKGQKHTFFKPWHGILLPVLITLLHALGGWLFFRHHLPSWSLFSLAAIGLGSCGFPIRGFLYHRISMKRRSQFYQAFIAGNSMEGIKPFRYGLCDLLVIPSVAAVMFGMTYLIQRFVII